jgi:hypothetical protein
MREEVCVIDAAGGSMLGSCAATVSLAHRPGVARPVGAGVAVARASRADRPRPVPMTFRDTPDDRQLLEVIRTYLQLVMGRSTPPPASDAIRYALRLAADAVLPMVEGKR